MCSDRLKILVMGMEIHRKTKLHEEWERAGEWAGQRLAMPLDRDCQSCINTLVPWQDFFCKGLLLDTLCFCHKEMCS